MSPERWLCLEVRTPVGVDPGALAAELSERCGGSVMESGDTLVAYVAGGSVDPEALVASLTGPSARRPLPGGPTIRWFWQDHHDWATLWRRGLRTRRVGRRFVVRPSWEPAGEHANDLVIDLDPGVAFGTAEHATTRGCLVLIEDAVAEGDAVLDAGTGSAILAIAAALLGAVDVLGVDADPMACDAAAENVTRNRVADRVRILTASLTSTRGGTLQVDVVPPPFGTDGVVLGDPLAGGTIRLEGSASVRPGAFDVVVANMVSGRLSTLMPGLVRAVRPRGRLVLGGLQTHERAGALSIMDEQGLVFDAEREEDGWWCGRWLRPGSTGAGHG